MTKRAKNNKLKIDKDKGRKNINDLSVRVRNQHKRSTVHKAKKR